MSHSSGRVAQLGEHLLCKQGVGGSSPPTSTNHPLKNQLCCQFALFANFVNLGPFGSKKQPLYRFNRTVLVCRYRMQVDLARDFG